MSDNILIYTDGSCTNNRKDSGIGGYAAIIYKNKYPVFISGYEENTTNQRMEMMGVISSLEYILTPSKITLCTDSAYVYNCMCDKWYESWRKNGWKNAKNEPVANKDLWERMLTILEFHESVKFVKVKAHKDNPFNNKCDELAKDIVEFQRSILDKIEK